MIEYGPPAERRGTVAISALRQYNTIRQSFPEKIVSAEGVLFTLSKLVENTVEDSEHMPAFVEEITEKLFQAYGSAQKPNRDNDSLHTSLDTEDLKALVENFRTMAFFEDHTLRDRYTILVSHACHTTPSNDLPRTLIAYRLAKSLQKLSSTLARLPFSAEVLAQHKEVEKLIRTITGQADTDTDSSITIQNDWKDTCDFCSAPIPLTDLTTAMCTNGHQFPRCGLSFLAIQAPGITKYCGICSTPYFSEEFVDAQEMDSEKKGTGSNGAEEVQGEHDLAQEPTKDTVMSEVSAEMVGIDKRPVTLARVLFFACDVCIYCGGKFTA
jgi:hypothetical protein